jgi:predicted kinase
LKTLYLVRGVSGAGKSTFAEQLADSMGIYRFEADAYFSFNGTYNFDPAYLKDAHEWCQGKCKYVLSQGYSVVISNTSTTEAEVQTYTKIAEETSAMFVSLIVENRHGNKSIHNVPDAVIQRQKSRFSIKL